MFVKKNIQYHKYQCLIQEGTLLAILAHKVITFTWTFMFKNIRPRAKDSRRTELAEVEVHEPPPIPPPSYIHVCANENLTYQYSTCKYK